MKPNNRTLRHEGRTVRKQFDDNDATIHRQMKSRPKVYYDDLSEETDAIQRALKGKNRKGRDRHAFGIMYLTGA